jgi:hypothetical protein
MSNGKKFLALALAVAAVSALTGTASATVLTSPSGTTYTSTIEAESEGSLTLHNTSIGVSVMCNASRLAGKIEQHGANVTSSGKLSTFTLVECGEDAIKVLSPGSIEFHATGGGNGTVTWSGAAITTTDASTGISCTYTTSSTDIGTLTGSGSTSATLHINSATIPRTGDSFFCGSSGQWTASYRFTTPSTLLVD